MDRSGPCPGSLSVSSLGSAPASGSGSSCGSGSGLGSGHISDLGQGAGKTYRCLEASFQTVRGVLLPVQTSLPPRSLDLTGPLLLGGVPKLPEDFPVQNRQFVGCIKDLRIDDRHVDMAGFIANNGTLPGTLSNNA